MKTCSRSRPTGYCWWGREVIMCCRNRLIGYPFGAMIKDAAESSDWLLIKVNDKRWCRHRQIVTVWGNDKRCCGIVWLVTVKEEGSKTDTKIIWVVTGASLIGYCSRETITNCNMNPLTGYCHGIEGFHGLAISCNILVAVTVATASVTRTKRRAKVPKVIPFDRGHWSKMRIKKTQTSLITWHCRCQNLFPANLRLSRILGWSWRKRSAYV